jgi:quinoprotein glucose dehydrogenase
MNMTDWRARRPIALLAAIAAAVATTVTSLAQAPADRWWTGYGNGADNSRYFEARQIDKGNVGRLEVAWSYPFGDTGSSPIVVRGVAYGRGRNGSLVAVDARTGVEVWVRERMNGMTSRGLNYWESPDGRDQRLIFSMNSLLQQVDAKTGKSILSFGTNGVVDLREGIDGRDPGTIGNIQSNTPGEIFENLLILGSAPGEGYMSPPGDIRAYDVLTGRLAWTFHTVPHPGEYGYETWPKDAWKYVGGTNNWGEMTVDAARGIAYVPIGSPTYDFYGADRPGANLFGTSIVALDARTGKRLWHFQLVHHDLWDMDPSAAPQLTTIRQDGRTRDVVAVTAKTGWLYVFDRVTGEPIWPIEERPFPKSAMEGEQSWPTQPVPTTLPPYVRHTFTVDDVSPHLPAEEAAALKARLLAANNNGIFTPLGTRDTVSVPASNGGTLFGGTAAEPRTGAVYVVAHDNPGIVRLLRPGEGRGFGPPVPPGQTLYEQNCQACHGVNRQGTDTGAPLVHATADPANNIAAGAPRFDGAAIRAVLATGKNRMPPFPHLAAADVDALVSLLTTAAGERGRGPFPGRGAGAAASGAPPELIAGSGSAWVRPDAPAIRRGTVPYPEGTPAYTRYTINEYHTVAHGVRPPFTTIVKFDLNAPAIKWRVPFGDDPALAARGITGTGAPATNNGIILTASGLVFGAGLDNHIRAWDGDSGRELWSARFGGAFAGSPVMYTMGGRQYLLVAAASTSIGRGAGPTTLATGPIGWVAYALPEEPAPRPRSTR